MHVPEELTACILQWMIFFHVQIILLLNIVSSRRRRSIPRRRSMPRSKDLAGTCDIRSPAGSDKGTTAAAAKDQEQWRSRGSRGAERCNRGSIREEASGVEPGSVAGGRRTARGSIRDWRGGRRTAREMLTGMDLGLSSGDEEGGRGGSCGRGRQLPELWRRVKEL